MQLFGKMEYNAKLNRHLCLKASLSCYLAKPGWMSYKTKVRRLKIGTWRQIKLGKLVVKWDLSFELPYPRASRSTFRTRGILNPKFVVSLLLIWILQSSTSNKLRHKVQAVNIGTRLIPSYALRLTILGFAYYESQTKKTCEFSSPKTNE